MADTTPDTMCPHCGARVSVGVDGLTAYHTSPPRSCFICPGSKQNPRCAESDARPLWNGEPNPHFAG